MVFSSLVFLCVFLPIVLLGYYLIPSLKAKNCFLIAASLLFYAYGEPVYVLLMLGSILMNYGFGRWLEAANRGRKGITALAVVLNLGLLFVFKYLDMMIQTVNQLAGSRFPLAGLALPIGISFFTFQALSYVIDVYRGEAKGEKSLACVMLYISFFPQLIAGPIVKYHDIREQIHDRKGDPSEIAFGLRRFILGLSKKVLIANPMAVTADALFAEQVFSTPAAWTAAVAYLFQIYFDFSGYSDMAIGLGHMFGFCFLENFKYPYISKSIQEFWRRWHISLSTWLKEYLYIPLGGNRRGKVRTCINKLIVFFATGLWHGANWTFVVWGLWHGLWMLAEEALPFLKKMPGFLRHLYTLLVVCVGFVMFRADSFGQGIRMIGAMFGKASLSRQPALLAQLTPLFFATLAFAVIGSLPVAKWMKCRMYQKKTWVRIWESAGFLYSLALLVLCLLNLSAGTYNPFIYFRF
ncbi:MAG: MBOAT family protein [Clostridia bacterium]|nr:MBOAT family protein [Clostridia bacterium]